MLRRCHVCKFQLYEGGGRCGWSLCPRRVGLRRRDLWTLQAFVWEGEVPAWLLDDAAAILARLARRGQAERALRVARMTNYIASQSGVEPSILQERARRSAGQARAAWERMLQNEAADRLSG